MLFRKIVLLGALLLLPLSLFCGMHHTNRYLPFLERPKSGNVRNFSDFSTYLFFASSSSVLRDSIGKEKRPLPELFGEYDLKNVIDSLKEVTEKINGDTFVNPFISVGGAEGTKFVDHAIKYSIHGKIKTVGAALQYEQKIWDNFSVQFFIPFMQISSNHEFSFKINERTRHREGSNFGGLEPLAPGEDDLINRVRRATHDAMRLSKEDFVESGFGDVDLCFRFHNDWDHKLLMRKIALDLNLGFLFPTGEKRRIHNPASIPFMGNGHFGAYIEFAPEFELKPDWKLGFMLGFLIQENKTKLGRMAVGDEPYIYSALEGLLRTRPGYMFKFSPYFNLGGLTDGLSAQFRVTHLRHGSDKLRDSRSASEQVSLNSNLVKQEESSKWKSNFFTFQLVYDSRDAMKKWWLSPNAFFTYDSPLDWFGGTKAVRHHQFSFGLELHF